MRKTARQLEDDIDTYLRGEKSGPRQVAPSPKYDPKRGAWYGGDRKTLYTFTDPATGNMVVRPGGGVSKSSVLLAGPQARVRIATKAEAERLWQSPLHSGWLVTP